MHPLERAIKNTIIHDRLIRDDEQTVLIGVSGGPDSVALLHVLQRLRKELGIFLVAAYINHGLRPVEAEQEDHLVRSLCEKLGIVYETTLVDVRTSARQRKVSLEHAARDLRYDALRTIAEKHDASVIAVAHTADDQVEEILIRLLRGSGRKGISGMRSRAGNIIRPMLSVEKAGIVHYLEERKIPYCLDSSNSDMRFVRNRVRHRLIPYMEETFDRGLRRSLCKTAEALAEDENLLEELTSEVMARVMQNDTCRDKPDEQKLTLDRMRFSELHPALQRRVAEKLLWMMGCRATHHHIMNIIEAAATARTGAELHLSRGLRVGVQKKHLAFLYPRGKTAWRGKLYKKK